MKRLIGVEFAFDRLWSPIGRDILAAASLSSDFIDVRHVREIIGQIFHNFPTGTGKIKFEFYTWPNAEKIGEISNVLDDAIHDASILNFGDLLVITITNNDIVTRTITSGLAGHYSPFKK